MKDLTGYLRELSNSGYTVTKSQRGHYRISKDGEIVATASSTPGNGWALVMLKTYIRRWEHSKEDAA